MQIFRYFYKKIKYILKHAVSLYKKNQIQLIALE